MSTANMTSSQMDGVPDGQTTPHPLGRLSASTLSMRNKKQLKRNANAQHNSNFHAGYVPVTEDVLHRSGIRGRKRYFLYCTISILLVVAFFNTLVTACLLYLLRVTHGGVGNMEVVNQASRSFVHFFGVTFVSSLLLNGVPIGSQHGDDMTVTSQNSSISINSFKSSNNKWSPSLTLDGSTISVLADSLRIRTNGSDQWTVLDVQTVAKMHGISNYYVNSLTTSKIQNYKDHNDLYLESPLKTVEVRGSEAVALQSKKDMEFNARDIFLESNSSDVVFQGKRSVYLDPQLPRAPTSSSSPLLANKICVCGNGKLFYVHGTSPSSCDIGKDLAFFICRK